MADGPFQVLFLCTGNSARSIMAEAILNKVGRGKFHAHSAGSAPKGEVNPHTIQVLRRLGYDTAGFRSKSWGEFAEPGAPALDFVFTVCDHAAGETCPLWPGRPPRWRAKRAASAATLWCARRTLALNRARRRAMTAHWGIPDPAAAKGTAAEIAVAFNQAYRMLFTRIGAFTALPIASLDQLSLQQRLEEIGCMQGATAKMKEPS